MPSGIQNIHTLQPEGGLIAKFAFSTYGQLIAIPCQEGFIKIWEFDENFDKSKYIVTFTIEAGSPTCTFWIRETLIAGTSAGRIYMWHNFSNFKPIVFEGHDSLVTDISYYEYQQKHYITSSSLDGTVRNWDLNTKHELDKITIGNAVNCFVFGKYQPALITADASGKLKFWDRHNFKYEPFEKHRSIENGSPIISIDISQNDDYKIVVTGDEDGNVRIWDLDEYELLETLNPKHNGSVVGVSLSKDSVILASKSKDHSINLWKRNNKNKWKHYGHLKEQSSDSDFSKLSFFQPNQNHYPILGDILASTSENDKVIKILKLNRDSLIEVKMPYDKNAGAKEIITSSPKIDSKDYPIAFISHSSADNQISERLAKDLLRNGVNAWYSEWEIRLGDSLREKIDQGIGEAEFFIIILSKDSIKSEWVKTELDAAMVKKIRGSCRIISILHNISEENIPETLAGLKWMKLDKYDSSFQELLKECHGRPIKPPIGESPFKAKEVKEEVIISKMSNNAKEIGKYLCNKSEYGLEHDPIIYISDLAQDLKMTIEDVEEAADELKDLNFVGISLGERGALRIWTKHALFWEFDKEIKGWDKIDDARCIAQKLIAKEEGVAGLNELVNELGWEIRRINTSASYLAENDYVHVDPISGTHPLSYAWLRATPKTRRFTKGEIPNR